MQQLNYVEILRLSYGKGIGIRKIAQMLGLIMSRKSLPEFISKSLPRGL